MLNCIKKIGEHTKEHLLPVHVTNVHKEKPYTKFGMYLQTDSYLMHSVRKDFRIIQGETTFISAEAIFICYRFSGKT